MSMFLPCGEEKHWCDLRVRTLWSERRPDHYVGAVGQLTDPQLSAKQPLMVTAANAGAAAEGASRIAEEIRRLKTIFDVFKIEGRALDRRRRQPASARLRSRGKHGAVHRPPYQGLFPTVL